MKKAAAVTLAILLALALFSGCAREEREEHVEPDETRLHKDGTSDDAKCDGSSKKHFNIPRRYRTHRTENKE